MRSLVNFNNLSLDRDDIVEFYMGTKEAIESHKHYKSVFRHKMSLGSKQERSNVLKNSP